MVDWLVVATTLKLAFIVTAALLVIGIPISWWLSHSQSRFKGVVEAVCTLPMVLPPTVLGFYLLVLLSPNSAFGQALDKLGIAQLPFSFAGIAVACTIHSLPFVIQPLKNAFEAIACRVGSSLGRADRTGLYLFLKYLLHQKEVHARSSQNLTKLFVANALQS